MREWLGLVNPSQVKVYAGIRPRDDFAAPIVNRIQAASPAMLPATKARLKRAG